MDHFYDYQISIPSSSPPERCPVCDENHASKHYGSYCCSSCKGFFRRSSRFQRVYICPYQNNCNVSGVLRNACRACRYFKCLSIGMNPLLVQSDRDQTKKPPKLKSISLHSKLSINSPNSNRTDSGYSSPSSASEVLPFALLPIKEIVYKQALYTLKIPENFKTISINLPLGRLNLINVLKDESPYSIPKYYSKVERLIDNFKETDAISHFCDSFTVQSNVSASQLFDEPRLLCQRTELNWSSSYYTSGEKFPKTWARSILSYFDWVSFIPELQSMIISDRNLMLIHRCSSSLWMQYSHRAAIINAPGILFSSGCYFPREKTEWKYCEPQIVAMGSQISDTFNVEIVDEMRRLKITDEEFAVLRVLNFFTAVPQLSKEGYEIVQNARRKYANILTELIRVKNASQPFTMIIERINRFMLLLPVFEKVSQINDDSLSMLVLFNMAEMKQSLTYELHIGKNTHK